MRLITMDQISQKKQQLRKKMMRERDLLSRQEVLEKSRMIQSLLFDFPGLTHASNIFIYVSYRSEVFTHDIIRALLSKGKTVTVPLTDMSNKKLIPYCVSDFDSDLEPGAMGILEPRTGARHPVALDDIDIVITPGVVFCEDGRRIGYGGGFYDRFFSLAGKQSCALAFELQVLPDIPVDPRYDKKVDCIITEKRIISCLDK
jgi:5-formyltetrahydrofolate cyclo-ligase